MLVTDVNQLRQYFSDPKVGAYAPGAPTPEQPPPPCGLAVPNQADNPGLMRDCITLLAAKDTLRGTATLDWTVTSTISTWEGIGLNASSTRASPYWISTTRISTAPSRPLSAASPRW